jgi:hypothetical protein
VEGVVTNNRDELIEKIRALMSKTVANGCTEAEALAALDKARAFMDAYEVTEAELQLTKEEAAILRSEPPGSRDMHNIKFYWRRLSPSSATAKAGGGQTELCSAACRPTRAWRPGCSTA